jgi:Butirosin biosynthesis protein H, N-terminal
MREIRKGKTCLLSSVSNVLVDYDGGLTEEMLFLFGHGNRIDYKIEQDGSEPPVYIGHHSAAIMETFLERFGIPQQRRTGSASDGGLLDEIRSSLADGNPIVIWVDMARLDYLRFRPPQGSIHALTIEAESSGILSIADCYTPVSLYSDKGGTYRFDIPLGDFEAWKSTGYCRHMIEFRHLAGHSIRFQPAAIRQELANASRDYLHGAPGVRATHAVLHALADDLPQLMQQRSAPARERLCTALAYSVRYFGILWTREFLAALIAKLAQDDKSLELNSIAELFRAAAMQWKFVMLAILKISLADDWRRQAQAAASKIRALLHKEQDLYETLLQHLAH